MKIIFPNIPDTFCTDSAITIAEALNRIGHPMDLVCGGQGTCNKCMVDIEEGGRIQKVRACQETVRDGMRVLFTPESQENQILENARQPASAPFDPMLKQFSLPTDSLKAPLGGFDFEMIRQAVPIFLADLSWEALQKLNQLMTAPEKPFLTVVCYGSDVIAFSGSDTPLPLYGMAFDIGTTTVVGYLYDMNTGHMLAQASALNGQIRFGADVISRIAAAGESETQLFEIHTAIIDTLSGIIAEVCRQAQIASSLIYAATYCGNSTMINLLLNVSPVRLGRVPFLNTSRDCLTLFHNGLGLPVAPACVHTTLPLLGGFVGADTAAVLLSLPDDHRCRLMIDLGTNGEIAVIDGSRCLVASTACGPALEGAGLSMGMRGTTGAIERVRCHDGQFFCDVIGGGPAKGFCGSGIIDAIACLLSIGLILPQGSFKKEDAVADPALARRFSRTEKGQRQLTLLTSEENHGGPAIVITQKDIRAIQLAKGAIYTGCSLLLSHYGIDGSALSEIVISGAFGNYIDVHNAQSIGLLPTYDGVPVRSVGNGAGLGARKFLLNVQEQRRCDHIKAITTHLELASDPEFANAYILNTSFQ